MASGLLGATARSSGAFEGWPDSLTSDWVQTRQERNEDRRQERGYPSVKPSLGVTTVARAC